MFTPLVRLADILDKAFPPETRVVAGSSALDREVYWAISLRWNPPAFPGLRPSEIVLVSLQKLRQSNPGLTDLQLVQRLAEKAVTGVVVDGPLSSEAVARAEAERLVVLEVPPGTRMSELESEVNRCVAEERSSQYRASLEISNRLTRAAALTSGPCPVVRAFYEVTGISTAYLDVYGAVHCRSGVGWEALPKGWEGELVKAARSVSQAPLVRDFGPVRTWTMPITEGEHVHGVIVCLSRDDLTTMQLWALHRAALACALARMRAFGHVERRRQLGEFIVRAIKEYAVSAEVLLDQGRYLGLDFSGTFAVAAGAAASPHLLEAAWQAVDALGDGCAAEIDGSIVVVSSRTEEDLLNAIHRAADGAVSAVWGTSRSRGGVEGLRQAYREAVIARKIARITGKWSVSYSDAGPWATLAEVADTRAATEYCNRVLGPLEAYDQRRHLGLIATLEAFLQANGQISQAAERLNIHRNSMTYRLRRFEEISGLDLTSYEDLFKLQLALALRKLSKA